MEDPKPSIIQSDRNGLTNLRLLGKEEQVDYTRVEGASLKIMSRFLSPEGKRLFLRLFVTAQLQFNFIGGVARAVMDADVIDPLMDSIKVRVDDLHQSLNAAIDGAEVLFKQHGIANIASYDTPPLEVEVPILTALARRYYEAIVKFDQLMPLLQTLQIHEVVTDADADESRVRLKGDFRAIAGVSRRTADRLRTRLFKESKTSATSINDAPPVEAAGDRRSQAGARQAAPPGLAAKPDASQKGLLDTAGALPLPNGHDAVHEGTQPRLSANARKRRNRRLRREAEKMALAAAAQAAPSVSETGKGSMTLMDVETSIHDHCGHDPGSGMQPAAAAMPLALERVVDERARSEEAAPSSMAAVPSI